MVDRKVDDADATGTHAIWRGPVLETGGLAAGASPWKGVRPWAERVKAQPNHRHAAITRTLYSVRSYKSWADKVRSGWARDKDGDKER